MAWLTYSSLGLKRHRLKTKHNGTKTENYLKEFNQMRRCLNSTQISYLLVNVPFVVALQKHFRVKVKVNKNGDKMKR